MFVSKIKNQVKTVIAIFGIGLFAALPLGSFSAAFASPVTVQKLIELTNEARVANGLGILTINSLLLESAQGKSNDMLAKNYFAHTSPEGITPWDWFVKVGYDYMYAGENLAKNFATAESMFEAWMKSPSHRANILSENFKEIGIGVATDGNVIYVTQHFGTQKPGKAAGTTVATVAPTAPTRTVTTSSADTTPPVIKDIAPVDAVVGQGESVSFAITVTGNPVKVLARIGDKSVDLVEKDGQWTGSIKLLAGGKYTVMVEATDAAGNRATKSLGSVTVSIPEIIRHEAPFSALVAAYWQDVAKNEALPLLLALGAIGAMGLGVAGARLAARRVLARPYGHIGPAPVR